MANINRGPPRGLPRSPLEMMNMLEQAIAEAGEDPAGHEGSDRTVQNSQQGTLRQGAATVGGSTLQRVSRVFVESTSRLTVLLITGQYGFGRRGQAFDEEIGDAGEEAAGGSEDAGGEAARGVQGNDALQGEVSRALSGEDGAGDAGSRE